MSTVKIEQAGNNTYQNDHMNKIFSEGFSFSGFERDKLYLNQGGKKYVDISGLSGLDSVSDGRGAAYADFDNDGDYDFFLTALQGQVHYLFRNNIGEKKAFIRVTLEGKESGRDAYGAEVRVKTSQGKLTKIKAGGSGFVSQSDPRILFGLGDDTEAEWLEVLWPSGNRQRFEKIPASSSVKLVEGDPQLHDLDEHRFALPDPVSDEAGFFRTVNYGPGDKFPAITMVDQEGKSTNFEAYRRSDRSYIVNLWATYCGPCLQEMPELQRFSTELRSGGAEVVGISLDMGKTREKIPDFLAKMDISYPVFTTDETIFTHIFAGEQAFIPLSFIVDRQGRIVEVLTGWSETSEKRIRSLIDSE